MMPLFFVACLEPNAHVHQLSTLSSLSLFLRCEHTKVRTGLARHNGPFVILGPIKIEPRTV